MKTRGESEESPNAIPPYSRAARQFTMKVGNQFFTTDGSRYQIANDGAAVRLNRKTISRKQRNKQKREARKTA